MPSLLFASSWTDFLFLSSSLVQTLREVCLIPQACDPAGEASLLWRTFPSGVSLVLVCIVGRLSAYVGTFGSIEPRRFEWSLVR